MMDLTSIQPVGQILIESADAFDKINNKSDLSVQKAADSFAGIMKKAISDVQKLEDDSKMLANDLVLDRTTDLHKVMIAGEKANIALQFMVKVRNKALDAYQEVMRMQV
ncbi:MAG: flagellar hook-basal body complex protein FliE [bacterium]